MKTKKIALLFILLAALAYVTSCNRNKSLQSGQIILDSLSLERSTHLFGDTTMPHNSISIVFACPTDSMPNVVIDSIRYNILNNLFGPQYASMKPREAMLAYAAASDSIYLAEVEPELKEELAANPNYRPEGGLYSYVEELFGQVIYRQDSLLVYGVEIFGYTGGAHGHFFTRLFNLDLHTGKLIRLFDFLDEKKARELTDMLWKQLMEDQDVTSREALNEMGYGTLGDLYLTDNYEITPNGISFHFNQYEIAPYAMGMIVVTLSYKDLAPYILEDSAAAKLLPRTNKEHGQ
ncbi:DUF3298 domain-containing protein [Porphyromonas loveana]|uniref:DUF3298 domain-containing protein n=1 Tax=Porphyromonas loveana TaxID=1884669 RepID=UPI0035A1BC4C